MRRLCFGGSFNPIHHAHLICARAVAEAAGYDRVVLIPSAQPPHKPGIPLAAPDHRLAICRLAAAEQADLFEVEDIELQRTGHSYTIDTVRQLKERGWPEVHWLIGADMLMTLPQWHQPEELLKEARLVIMARPGWTIDWNTLPPSYRFLSQHVVIAPLLQISATEIRRRLENGQSVQFLTPESIIDYIQTHRLFA